MDPSVLRPRYGCGFPPEEQAMDVFSLRNRPIQDNLAYLESFIQIRDRRITQLVDQELRAGLLWPDALFQLNPTFEPRPWIDRLVDRRVSWRRRLCSLQTIRSAHWYRC
jgi:hypothetical protein